jgi:hypothetical protein
VKKPCNALSDGNIALPTNRWIGRPPLWTDLFAFDNAFYPTHHIDFFGHLERRCDNRTKRCGLLLWQGFGGKEGLTPFAITFML